MIRCKQKSMAEYEAIQWKGDNLKELIEAVGGVAKLGTSPYGDDQLTVQGGDSYLNIARGQWILKNDYELMIMDDSSFRSNYEIIKE